jgi:hypothetical protein
MPRLNRQNIDRKTNKPALPIVESMNGDRLLERSNQIRRDDDVIRTKKRTLYDIDYAIKWFIENEIQPQLNDTDTLINVPVIFSNGEKWDNVRRLGYLRDEKGMLQSPLIMLKRNSVAERDSVKTLDVNWPQSGNQIVYKQKYNAKNRYEDDLFPIPTNIRQQSEQIYVVDIPKYVTIEYDMMIWCDYTTQMNELIDQILPYGRFAWGQDATKFATTIGSISFETTNTIGEDRLVRATIPLTVLGTLLSEQESRVATLKKMYSIKQLTFDTVIDVDTDIFNTTTIPVALLNVQSAIFSGTNVMVSNNGSNVGINAATMLYLTDMTDNLATYVNTTTISLSVAAAQNPITGGAATKNEFDIFINGQYMDKVVYTWTPSLTASQTIIFDTNTLGFTLQSGDIFVVKGRWA